jgi:NADH-quinone oxidoreductase subunit M
MLAWTIYVSFLGAAGLALLPREQARLARRLALIVAIAGLGCALGGAVTSEASTRLTTITKVAWVPTLGIEYHLAADGISLVLVVLTGLAAVAGILFSWNIEHRAKEFFAFYLTLIGGVYGVFLSFDAFLLFVFYEIAIIPKYFLIAIWGSTRKEYGAMKLALYSFVGSALVLIGLLAGYVQAGGHTFNLVELARVPFPRDFQMWAFPVVFVGFAILAGLWPFHTWAPTGHVAAPTAASMLLAGVVMKLGAYGVLRVAMPLFPLGMENWSGAVLGVHSWRELFAGLGTVGIVYGAMVALVQRDFKFVIGYSSVSHMGFVLLGLMTLTDKGLSGAVLQMFSHGVIAGLLFGVVGRMVYERTHTRELAELEPMNLGRALPFAGVTFVLGGLASMGMPGFSGFVAELQVLIGAWQSFPAMALVTGVGILLGVAYIIRALQKAFYSGQGTETGSSDRRHSGQPTHDEPSRNRGPNSPAVTDSISLPERIGALILLATTLVVGLYPPLLLKWIHAGLQTPLLSALLKKGAP